MLMRTDTLRDVERLTQQLLGTTARPSVMAMDAWRDGDEFVAEFDLPGVSAESIELNVERTVLTVRAERVPATGPETQLIAAERPRGVFSRQLVLGDTLDTENIRAAYNAGVLTVRIPVSPKAQPRRIAVLDGSQDHQAIRS